MQVNGEWLFCDDGIERPVIRGEILSDNGSWRAVEFLVDTGADRTILSANVFESLNLPFTAPDEQIGGVGGMVNLLASQHQSALPAMTLRKLYFAVSTQHVLNMSRST